MKIALFAGGAFVVALAAGTGVSILTAPRPQPLPAAADSLHAASDSSHAAAHGTDSATHADSAHAAPIAAAAEHGAKTTPLTSSVVARADSSARSVRDGGARPAAGDHAVVGKPDPATPASAVVLASAPESDAGYKQVARVLSNMKPADAAAIVAHLSDDQLDGVLRQLGVRQAASLLGALPVERAAAMSRRMIRTPPKTEAR